MAESPFVESAVVVRALQMLDEQRFVPNSPASYDALGNPCLCAAGILARAGLELATSERDAMEFAHALAQTKDARLLYASFSNLGWSAATCGEVVGGNDNAKPAVRKQVVAQIFRDVSGAIMS